MKLPRIAIACALAVSAGYAVRPAMAQEGPVSTSKPAARAAARVVEMRTTATDLKAPLLSNRLTVPLTDRTPGNAAPLYLQVGTISTKNPLSEPLDEAKAKELGLKPAVAPEVIQWGDAMAGLVALDKLPLDAIDKVLAEHANDLKLLELAARRERCEWELPWREQGFSTLLPHLARLKQTATYAHIKARAQLARGDVEGSLQTLSLNIAMAKALGRDSFLIQSLVGISISSKSLEVLREIQQHPKCPNLYWVLADLRSELGIDLKSCMEMERAAVMTEFPELKRARTNDFVPADLNRMLVRMMKMGVMVSTNTEVRSGKPGLSDTTAAAGVALALTPAARQYLISRGTPEADVAAMDPAMVVARYMVLSSDEIYDEMIRMATIPYWQLNAAIRTPPADLRRGNSVVPMNPVTSLIPPTHRILSTQAMLYRDIAALQTVEALRGYVARHGNPPQTLAELANGPTPAPINPLTGQTFEYAVSSDVVVLRSPAAQDAPQDKAMELKLRIVR